MLTFKQIKTINLTDTVKGLLVVTTLVFPETTREVAPVDILSHDAMVTTTQVLMGYVGPLHFFIADAFYRVHLDC